MEEKAFSISGSPEGPGPRRVDLAVEYYKIYLRKKQPRPPSSSPSVSWSRGVTSMSRCWKGEEVIAGHWCPVMMEQHKIFLALWTHTNTAPLPSALLCWKEAAESDS